MGAGRRAGPLTLKGHTNDVFSVELFPGWPADAYRELGWDCPGVGRGQRQGTSFAHKPWCRNSVYCHVLVFKGHSARVYSAAFSPDGQRFVTGSSHGTTKVWGGASGRELLTLTGHTNWVFSAAFSPDGLRIVTASDGNETAKVWDAASGRDLLTLNATHRLFNSVAFSPDGQRIVTGRN